MLIIAPNIPLNFRQKIRTALKPFVRQYDHYTLGELRRLFRRADFVVSVFCQPEFTKNGEIKCIHIMANSSQRPSNEIGFASSLNLSVSDANNAGRMFVSACEWIVDIKDPHQDVAGALRPDRVSDEQLKELVEACRFSTAIRRCEVAAVEESSLQLFGHLVRKETEIRNSESHHSRLKRIVQPKYAKTTEALEESLNDAKAWFAKEVTRGYNHYLSPNSRNLPHDLRLLCAYRQHLYNRCSKT